MNLAHGEVRDPGFVSVQKTVLRNVLLHKIFPDSAVPWRNVVVLQPLAKVFDTGVFAVPGFYCFVHARHLAEQDREQKFPVEVIAHFKFRNFKRSSDCLFLQCGKLFRGSGWFLVHGLAPWFP
jgi:hypothetical protein